MSEVNEVDALGVNAHAHGLAEDVFDQAAAATVQAPVRAARARWMALAIFALALAIAFHALFRYETITNDVETVRIDRLTGTIVRCLASRPVCDQPAVVHFPRSAGDLTAIAEDARQEIRDSISGEQAKRTLDSLAAKYGRKSRDSSR